MEWKSLSQELKPLSPFMLSRVPKILPLAIINAFRKLIQQISNMTWSLPAPSAAGKL